MKPVRLAAVLAAAGALFAAPQARAQHDEGGYHLAGRLYNACSADSGPDAERRLA